MDLRSDQAFWPIKNGLLETYPSLGSSISTDVLILGGGISGALLAYSFALRGVEVVVIDKREIGWGSTAASTAMLQYEIDTNLYDLVSLIGRANAERCYWQGVEAIDQLLRINRELGQETNMEELPSLYLARTEEEFKRLKLEYEARSRAGLEVNWIGGKELNQDYGIRAEAAIWSSKAAAVDAYQLTHALLARAKQHGALIYDKSEVTGYRKVDQGYRLTTSQNYTLDCKQLIVASGYESARLLKQDVVSLNSTYALATEPMDINDRLGGRYLLWEMSRPYFYLRPTADQRLLLGGEDIPFKSAHLRDAQLNRKSKKIVERYQQIFPDCPKPEVAFSWAGTFGETRDGLPYIGESPEWPEAYFALGYGGNGITYSMLAANLLVEAYQGRISKDLDLYSFNRPNAG